MLEDYIRERRKSRTLYMPYLTAGEPDLESTVRMGTAMIEAGADILELGIPFSDPTADGPVIQRAMMRALSHTDYSLEGVFEAAGKIHEKSPKTPIVLLTYVNPVLSAFRERYDRDGLSDAVRRFLERSEQAGVRGLVIPDLPIESNEYSMLESQGREAGIDLILMLAPNTDKDRMKWICRSAKGFIYYVTSLGVTGERSGIRNDLASRVAAIRKKTDTPVFAGFGVSRPEQAAEMRNIVDGVIVGSLHHRVIEEEGDNAVSRLSEITSGFTAALSANTGPSETGQ